MCLRDLYQHFQQREKEEVQIMDMKDLENISNDQDFNLPEGQELNLLAKDEISKEMGHGKPNDDEMTEQAPSNLSRNLMRDKEFLGGEQLSNLERQDSKKSGGLPTLKSSSIRKNKKHQKNQKPELESTINNLMTDKEMDSSKVVKENENDNDAMTEMDQNSAVVGSDLLKKNKEIFQDSNPIQKGKPEEIPDLKSSKKLMSPPKESKRKRPEPDPIIRGALSSDEGLMHPDELLNDGVPMELTGTKYKRNNKMDGNVIILTDVTPVATTKDKYKRDISISNNNNNNKSGNKSHKAMSNDNIQSLPNIGRKEREAVEDSN
jgi:hypothetical protein